MSTTTNSGSSCPAENVWDAVAVGLLKGDEAVAAMEHASNCAACAQTLREAIEIFAVEEPATTNVVSIGVRPRLAPAVRWLKIAAALLVAVGAGYLATTQFRSPQPLTLLSRAYTEHRTLDLRLPGAAYGGMQLERGGETRKPTHALEAELAFRSTLERTPNDPSALHAKGRWAILYGTPDDAIVALTAARDATGKADAGLLTELAIAWREKGRRSAQAADSLHAIEFLGQALQLDPTNAAALFNRAVVEDELNLWRPAILDLEKLLTVEPSGPWSDETRKRLAEIRGKV